MAHVFPEAIHQKLGELAERVDNVETVIRGAHAVLRTIAYNAMLESLPEDKTPLQQQEQATRMLELVEESLRPLLLDATAATAVSSTTSNEGSFEMASSFLIAWRGNAQLWACIDPESFCTSPLVGERRWPAYLAPFLDEAEARQALLEAGAQPETIAPEQRPRRRRG